MNKKPTTDKGAKKKKGQSAAERNRIERQRQSEIDDEIQQLMAFLPPRPPQKMSRNDVLKEIHEMVLKIKAEQEAKGLTLADYFHVDGNGNPLPAVSGEGNAQANTADPSSSSKN
ncbi:unnamed protein product [Caenorhabditis sp. 36 PRJEB53466]|nr:unnamed protein product [Caenorhabditis sp. 36 PRJEB53466]